ncbi:MAG: DUF1289 domain-containing protein [Nevskiaceae bacterium]|nr:MAG: DUF1289 domain-containing protein [Nevskiaceae bacterium]TAM29820.1 MAG: DUF1289 domain-containing protein [Nevskiaceae bacterium]
MPPDANHVSDSPASPCVGICQLQGRLCVGCGRELGEIAEWSGASPARKARIVEAASERLAIIRASATRPMSS